MQVPIDGMVPGGGTWASDVMGSVNNVIKRIIISLFIGMDSLYANLFLGQDCRVRV